MCIADTGGLLYLYHTYISNFPALLGTDTCMAAYTDSLYVLILALHVYTGIQTCDWSSGHCGFDK